MRRWSRFRRPCDLPEDGRRALAAPSPELLDLFARQREASFRAVENSSWRLADGLVLLQLLQLRLGHIHQPTTTQFTYRLWFPQLAKWPQAEVLFDYLLLLAQQRRLAVAWIGMQHSNGQNASPSVQIDGSRSEKPATRVCNP